VDYDFPAEECCCKNDWQSYITTFTEDDVDAMKEESVDRLKEPKQKTKEVWNVFEFGFSIAFSAVLSGRKSDKLKLMLSVVFLEVFASLRFQAIFGTESVELLDVDIVGRVSIEKF
jgi:hypothetical protein